MDLEGSHESVWIATAPGVECPRLEEGLGVDVGCVVAWNHLEICDCPCHGSRFGGAGGVLHGPTRPPPEQEAS